ncbi:unnamed protein product [Brassica napus]|uniref:(rape) hypothetical protein n=1 Tax=Brassica napus TaxID=3708 RepID=A0A816NY48_BRANA|nr:unnamed protein product [Brassica napus]
MEGKKVIGGLGFAWCRSGTDWLRPPRGFSRLACEQGSDPAFHQLNRSPSRGTRLATLALGLVIMRFSVISSTPFHIASCGSSLDPNPGFWFVVLRLVLQICVSDLHFL